MAKYEVVISSVIGKIDADHCEDIYVTGSHLFAVIDGATSKHPRLYSFGGRQISSGRFAAEVIAGVLSATKDSDPELVVSECTKALHKALREQGEYPEKHQLPSASISVFDSKTETVWGVGDCKAAWMVGGVASYHDVGFVLDDILSRLRKLALELLSATGNTWDGVGNDPGREAILPFLKMQGHLANTSGEFGYGVINGEMVSPTKIWSHSVTGAERVILASDGYPVLVFEQDPVIAGSVAPSLLKAEAFLAQALAEDPRCVGILRSTKGLMPGQVSFDDRTWLELERS